MYKFCTTKTEIKEDVTILKICYAHFMKNASSVVDKEYAAKKELAKTAEEKEEYKVFKRVILNCIASLCFMSEYY